MRTKLAEQPRSLYELLREFDNVEYRTLLQAWGALRADCTLIPDDKGRYRLG